jgi:hypothetical protein
MAPPPGSLPSAATTSTENRNADKPTAKLDKIKESDQDGMMESTSSKKFANIVKKQKDTKIDSKDGTSLAARNINSLELRTALEDAILRPQFLKMKYSVEYYMSELPFNRSFRVDLAHIVNLGALLLPTVEPKKMNEAGFCPELRDPWIRFLAKEGIPVFHFEYAAYRRMEAALEHFGIRFKGGLAMMIARKRESVERNVPMLYEDFEILDEGLARGVVQTNEPMTGELAAAVSTLMKMIEEEPELLEATAVPKVSAKHHYRYLQNIFTLTKQDLAEYDNAVEATNRHRYEPPDTNPHRHTPPDTNPYDPIPVPVYTLMNPWFLRRKILVEGLETVLADVPNGEWYARTYMTKVDAVEIAALEEPEGPEQAEWERGYGHVR